MFWNMTKIYLFFFSIQKTSRAIARLFFSNFFQSSFSHGKFIPFHLYLFIQDLVFVFLLFYDLVQLLQHIESIYCIFYWWHLLLLLLFHCPVRRIYIWSTTIRIYFMTFNNAINKHNQRQTHYLPSFLNYFEIFFWVIQKIFL